MNIAYAFIVNYFVEFVYHVTELRYGVHNFRIKLRRNIKG
jgi:hypothetical protein